VASIQAAWACGYWPQIWGATRTACMTDFFFFFFGHESAQSFGPIIWSHKLKPNAVWALSERPNIDGSHGHSAGFWSAINFQILCFCQMVWMNHVLLLSLVGRRKTTLVRSYFFFLCVGVCVCEAGRMAFKDFISSMDRDELSRESSWWRIRERPKHSGNLLFGRGRRLRTTRREINGCRLWQFIMLRKLQPSQHGT
jgi:hypothetical protein